MLAPLQLINDPVLDEAGIQFYLKREDLLHPHISGNKWRKLKYNLEEATKMNAKTLVSFGGAYSNHIYALAAAGQAYGFKTVGYIRGEETLPLNPTLTFATGQGMLFEYLDRGKYREKDKPWVLNEIMQKWGDCYIVPEGGSNQLAVKGCTEIIPEIDIAFDFLCSSIGTGGTFSGLVCGMQGEKKLIGFPALKNTGFLELAIESFILEFAGQSYINWELANDYHFGGYAKIKPELIEFINRFYHTNGVPLDPIYTGKMVFGLYDLIKQGYFSHGQVIVGIHTGGLQGIKGFKDTCDIQFTI